MDSSAREYDAKNRPQFNEWVRIDTASTQSMTAPVEMPSGADRVRTRGRSSLSAWIWPALLALIVGVSGGFAGGRIFGYQNGFSAGKSVGKAAIVSREPVVAGSLGRRIQAAIDANPVLNDKPGKNVIKVIVRDNFVNLKGCVMTDEIKDLAAQVANEAVTASGSALRVVNKLIVIIR